MAVTGGETRRRWWPRAVPVRVRITAAVVVLAALALAGAGVAVYVVQAERLDHAVNQSIARELVRFDQVVDTAREQGQTRARVVLLTALATMVRQPSESVIAFWDGDLYKRQVGDEHDALKGDEGFIAAVNRLTAEGGIEDIDSVEGPLRIAVKPIRDEVGEGALVYAYSLDEVAAELDDVMRTYALVSIASLMVVAFGAYVVAGRLLSPIRDLREAAEDISESDLTRRITATGNDDLTDLTVTFNHMLDRLESAFSTQRQFLDDVGHELKTPLTIVQGHLELMDADDAAEVGSTRDLVLDEVDRMGTLVGELLLLAKTRRPDFLNLEPVDLAAFTESVAEKMRGLGDREWRVDAAAAAVVDADPRRLTQAILQLAANAYQHTEPGDVIAIASGVNAERAWVSVRDTGSGIADDDLDRIFDRFRQAHDGAEGGLGLGLAIVRGIAEAHGGTVVVTSAMGRGSTFTISLPLRRAGRERGDRPW